MQTFLSICVPSRNRQPYFQETIRVLVKNAPDDIELVFVDNSDDPSVMSSFMPQFEADHRVRFVPACRKTFSMSANWNRAMEVATGRWVTFIGDDDYIDPAVAVLIRRIEEREPDAQAVAWNRLTFDWPGTKPDKSVTGVPTGCRVVDIPRRELLSKLFGWVGASSVPVFMFSAYHAAVRRDLMEENRTRYGGVYFEHPEPDQDSAMKTVCHARKLIFSERPFSVLGACPSSNSAALGRIDVTAQRHAEFMSDLGRNMDDDPHMKNFPFPSILGVTAAAACAQNWFKETYGLDYDAAGWELNFARACSSDCMGAKSLADFEQMRKGYAAAFRAWQDGKFLDEFDPVFTEPATDAIKMTGITDLLVYVEEMIGGATTPAALFDIVSAMMTPADEIPLTIGAKTVVPEPSVSLGQVAGTINANQHAHS